MNAKDYHVPSFFRAPGHAHALSLRAPGLAPLLNLGVARFEY